MSVENTAASILQRGVELDTKQRYTEALVCYQEGLQILVDSMKNSTGNKKTYLRSKIEEYMNRAEQIKGKVAKLKEEGKYHEQINIENNSTGYSYESVFGRFLDEDVIDVKVEDPYVRSFHQCQNFVRFCEVLIKRCKNLKTISLLTTKDGNNNDQIKWLSELEFNLKRRGIIFVIQYSATLHDREVILSTGWIIKIGRGLDYFKPPESKFSIGAFDMDFRCCHETTVDIFHSKNVKQPI
ncbi:hypothetical protein MML48_6g00012398 [Holotrichia oblita]|uniref:Uncharacterized protein n=1 Tax=Holotrichia oblita TaxID=644536 RepID=A0ACB9SZB1_HOLOL|nr:hypothetical protein MML48_6g00012398 [Holotrichia oblita]